MEIIEIQAKHGMRKAYQLSIDEQHFLEFKPEIEVLPASYFESENSGKFYFIKRHEPNTPGWKDGGYECYDGDGAKRAFFLDALIVHPRYFKKKIKSTVTGEMIDKPKGKRGRPKMDPSLLKVKKEYIPSGKGRGRPRKNPDEIKSKPYVPTGGKRGRKPLSEEERMKREAEKLAKAKISQGRRGRPRKN